VKGFTDALRLIRSSTVFSSRVSHFNFHPWVDFHKSSKRPSVELRVDRNRHIPLLENRSFAFGVVPDTSDIRKTRPDF
jgi:hypothetical protein